MRMRLVLAVLAVVLISLGGAGAGSAHLISSGAVAADCHAVKIISVRGSGDTSSYMGRLGTPIFQALQPYAQKRHVDFVKYGLPYQAAGIFQVAARGCAIGTPTLVGCIAGGWAVYQHSKNQGRDMLRSYIQSQCDSQKLVLIGFSQGAHVIADVLSRGPSGGLTARQRGRVAAVVIAGDPRFNSREGYDEGRYSIGRNGLMGARTPGDLSNFANRLKSWCRMKDWVCQGFPNPVTGFHKEQGTSASPGYLDLYKGAMVSFIVKRLGWDQPVDAIPGIQAIRGSTIQINFAQAKIEGLNDPGCPPPSDAVAAFNDPSLARGDLTTSSGQYFGGWTPAFTSGLHDEPDASESVTWWNGSNVVRLLDKVALMSPYGEHISMFGFRISPEPGCLQPIPQETSPLGPAYRMDLCFGRPFRDAGSTTWWGFGCQAKSYGYVWLSGMSSAALTAVKILIAGPITDCPFPGSCGNRALAAKQILGLG